MTSSTVVNCSTSVLLNVFMHTNNCNCWSGFSIIQPSQVPKCIFWSNFDHVCPVHCPRTYCIHEYRRHCQRRGCLRRKLTSMKRNQSKIYNVQTEGHAALPFMICLYLFTLHYCQSSFSSIARSDISVILVQNWYHGVSKSAKKKLLPLGIELTTPTPL